MKASPRSDNPYDIKQRIHAGKEGVRGGRKLGIFDQMDGNIRYDDGEGRPKAERPREIYLLAVLLRMSPRGQIPLTTSFAWPAFIAEHP